VVKGLDVFQNHFARYADQYVLIGGTAATLAMEEAGLEFRATKDLDIVLHIEVLNAEFAAAFWAFVEQGEYEIRHASKTGKPVLYRFQKPKNERFPAMLELFCRSPDGMVLAAGSQLTPIPIEDETASLSAILLDDAYYAFIIAGRKERDGLRWIGEEQLIPLKARAWLDLNTRRALWENRSTQRTSANTETMSCGSRKCSHPTPASQWRRKLLRTLIDSSAASSSMGRMILSPSASM
jgi:hypothetical protein